MFLIHIRKFCVSEGPWVRDGIQYFYIDCFSSWFIWKIELFKTLSSYEKFIIIFLHPAPEFEMLYYILLRAHSNSGDKGMLIEKLCLFGLRTIMFLSLYFLAIIRPCVNKCKNLNAKSLIFHQIIKFVKQSNFDWIDSNYISIWHF